MQPTMSGLLALGLVLLRASSLATPLTTHVKHEQRSASLDGPWERKARVDADAIVPVRIGLVQSNLDVGDGHLSSISHHESPLYGKHWTAEEVHSFFAPAEDTVEAVRSWLVSSGVRLDEIVHSDNKGWLALDIPVSQVNDLFKTSIHEFQHRGSGALRLGCEDYHVPSHLVEHIDYITPGVKLSAIVRKRDARQLTRSAAPFDLETRDTDILSRAESSLPNDLKHCDKVVTPECIRALYNLPVPTQADQANAPGFYEQGDYYSQDDLNGFFTNFAPQIANGTTPIMALIDGAVDPKASTSNQVEGEADGDLEIPFGLLYPTVPIVYQVDDPHYAKQELLKYNLFNTFLDAVSELCRPARFYSRLDK